MATPLSLADIAALEMLARQIVPLAAQYQQNPEDAGIVRQALAARFKLAEALERLADADVERVFRGSIGKAYQALLATDLRTEKYDNAGPPGESEQALTERQGAMLARGWGERSALQHFLALSLYRYPHELPRAFDLPRVPAWFALDYVSYMLAPPPLFRAVGEADAYLQYMREWSRYLAQGLAANPTHAIWRQAVLVYAQRANVIPLYFNEQNVKDIYCLRADLIEQGLRMMGHAVDHTPSRSPQREGPIRLGIMAATFQPSAESAASLPLYEHLGSEFEVTLYCLYSDNHPVERYCRSRAKALKVLPQDLKMQVEFLRAEQLDILFFATNVAAVTNQFALLAGHRLARAHATSIFSIVTTGFRYMDFYISGTRTDPSPAAQEDYRERLIQMDGSVHCFSYPVQAKSAVQMQRAHAGIDPSAIVYASGANLHKLRPELLHVWAKILAKTPGSILLLFPYGPNWSATYPKKAFMQLITGICAEHGVGPDRLRILDQTPAPNREDIREILRIADIYLDSFPFCGSTSLVEPLEIGLPVIVKAGEKLRASMAAAMINELATPELIAADEDAYIHLAIEMANNTDLRKRTAEKVRQNMGNRPRFVDSVSYAARIGPLFKSLIAQ